MFYSTEGNCITVVAGFPPKECRHEGSIREAQELPANGATTSGSDVARNVITCIRMRCLRLRMHELPISTLVAS
jgi:hypothetical protein